MGTSTLSRFQRGALAQLVNEGNKSYQVMADALGVAKATISYELDRVKPYDPELAQQDADRQKAELRSSFDADGSISDFNYQSLTINLVTRNHCGRL
ncbi:Mobile element protein [Levilactobacillus brevis]|nr:Mobile element protein [Levilactobacillus brevis]KIP00023.1 Mobile element protein [Levilactobacillus brevis]KIP00165.1 Mobile element protein [Levilactobacillus brevis]